MKICSWNVNSIRQRAHAAHDRLTPWLEANKPDVACLQELQCSAQQFPHAAVARAGYRAQVSAEKGKNGVAILTRLDAPAPKAVDLPWPPNPCTQVAPHEARFIAVQVSGVVVASIYVPYGRTPDDAQWARKLQFFADLKYWAESIIRSGQSLALVGDFNVAPDAQDASSVDALMAAGQPSPEVLWPAWCDPRMRRGLQALLDIGLHDVGALQPEEGRALTLWDERTFGLASLFGVRVDLMLVSAAMAARLIDVQVHSAMRDGPRPSDHVPIEATFRQVDRIIGT